MSTVSVALSSRCGVTECAVTFRFCLRLAKSQGRKKKKPVVNIVEIVPHDDPLSSTQHEHRFAYSAVEVFHTGSSLSGRRHHRTVFGKCFFSGVAAPNCVRDVSTSEAPGGQAMVPFCLAPPTPPPVLQLDGAASQESGASTPPSEALTIRICKNSAFL